MSESRPVSQDVRVMEETRAMIRRLELQVEPVKADTRKVAALSQYASTDNSPYPELFPHQRPQLH